jgi:regulator of protease activity HflC (stomatin/prohibitin superfamily)
MFEWIPAFFDKATAFVPRFEKVPPTFRMIKWPNCGDGTLHGPGCIWYWPLVTDHETVDIRWQSTVTTVQSLTMADGASVSARVLTLWKVIDPLLAVGENADYSDRAAEVSQSVVVDVLGKCMAEHLRTVEALNFATTVEVRRELEEIGLEVKRSKFTELVISPAFRIINDA